MPLLGSVPAAHGGGRRAGRGSATPAVGQADRFRGRTVLESGRGQIEALLAHTPLLSLVLPLGGLIALCAARRRPIWHASIVSVNVALSAALATALFIALVCCGAGAGRTDGSGASADGRAFDGDAAARVAGAESGVDDTVARVYATSVMGDWRIPLGLFGSRGFFPGPGSRRRAPDAGEAASGGDGPWLRIRITTGVDAVGLWALLGLQWAVLLAWTARVCGEQTRLQWADEVSEAAGAEVEPPAATAWADGVALLAFQCAAVGVLVMQDLVLWACSWLATGWVAWTCQSLRAARTSARRQCMFRFARWLIIGDACVLAGVAAVAMPVLWTALRGGNGAVELTRAGVLETFRSASEDEVVEAVVSAWLPWGATLLSAGLMVRVPWSPAHRWWHAVAAAPSGAVTAVALWGVALLPLWFALQVLPSVLPLEWLAVPGPSVPARSAASGCWAGVFAAGAMCSSFACAANSSMRQRARHWLAYHAAVILAAVAVDDVLVQTGAAVVAGQLLPVAMLLRGSACRRPADPMQKLRGDVRPPRTHLAVLLAGCIPGTIGFVGLALESDGLFATGTLWWLSFALGAVVVALSLLSPRRAAPAQTGLHAANPTRVSAAIASAVGPAAGRGVAATAYRRAGADAPEERDLAGRLADGVAVACGAGLVVLGIWPQALVLWLASG